MRRSFSQRHGHEPLPEPMRLEDLSDDLRREIWNAVRDFLLENRVSGRYSYYFHEQAKRFIERVLGRHTKQPGDMIKTEYDQALNTFKNSIIWRGV